MSDLANLQTISLPVLGMTCAGCASSVQSMIEAQDGVQSAEVNYATQLVKVSYEPGKITPEQFQAAVQAVPAIRKIAPTRKDRGHK